MSPAPLAHSAPDPSRAPQDYAAHILAVAAGARRRAEAMLRFAPPRSARLADTVETAGRFHDLGKLDPEVQRGLRSGRGARLDWDHIDAGVAHLAASGAEMAAWLVRAHHAPGLPARGKHFDPDGFGPRLRGRRADFDPGDLDAAERNTAQIRRTDTLLPQMLGTHAAAVGGIAPAKSKMVHGLPLRLCLSCLVDADHEDTARFDADLPPEPAREEPSPRWDERLRALDAYVANLPPSGNAERDRQRGAFYAACRDAPTDAPLVACEGPVGIGKTTAVPAHLLRVAQARGLRRIVVVAPFTNVISQTADILRQALTLPGEDAEAVVVEHHHRADFTSRAARDLAVLWQVPVVVTTAVQFFETLAACGPGALRKLHALPGSAIFLDEAHAALPAHLWPQNWRWLKQLTRNWSCHVVLASGSLARFWENPDVIDPPEPPLPELLPATLRHDVLTSERRRVRYASLGRISSVGELIETVVAKPGPRLVILNTVQSAAVVAREMRAEGHDVLHLSTALAPKDRGPILDLVKLKLRSGLSDWSLVATSCVEAGVDLSFRVAFRERFSVTSLIQIGGRTNRSGTFGTGGVFDFLLDGTGITAHPAAKNSAPILRNLLAQMNISDPAEVSSSAMAQEIAAGRLTERLREAERQCDYPEVSRLGRVIDADTKVVVVDPILAERIARRERVGFRCLLNGSVQLWIHQIYKLNVSNSPHSPDLYIWKLGYDPSFLGIMDGIIRLDKIISFGII